MMENTLMPAAPVKKKKPVVKKKTTKKKTKVPLMPKMATRKGK